MKRALFPGSFDPVTLGHEDIIAKASKLFDEVIVCAFVNSEKRYMFDDETRLKLLSAAVSRFENVSADISHTLVSVYAKEKGCGYIVKGCRNGIDFENEYEQALINGKLEPSVQTVLLPADPGLSFVSSTMVRELIKYGADFKRYLPENVAEIIK